MARMTAAAYAPERSSGKPSMSATSAGRQFALARAPQDSWLSEQSAAKMVAHPSICGYSGSSG